MFMLDFGPNALSFDFHLTHFAFRQLNAQIHVTRST